MDEKPTNGAAKKALEELEERDVDDLLQLETVKKHLSRRGKA